MILGWSGTVISQGRGDKNSIANSQTPWVILGLPNEDFKAPQELMKVKKGWRDHGSIELVGFSFNQLIRVGSLYSKPKVSRGG